MNARHHTFVHLVAHPLSIVPFRLLAGLLTCSLLLTLGGEHARAATISASYTAGYRDVTINGYGTAGLGMFVLDTGTTGERAWCIEADVVHSTGAGAYAEVPRQVDSPELDALVWSLARIERVDNDTAAAAAALSWYYAAARRSIGPLVWSDGARGFAPISPLQPQPWDALAKLSMTNPVGLRAGGVDLDAAERRVAELHRLATARRGPWALAAGATAGAFTVSGPGGPITGADIRITLHAPDRPDTVFDLRTGADGSAKVGLPAVPGGGSVTARLDAPGQHREWDGSGATQRMVTATTIVLTASTQLPPSPRYVEVHKSSADPTLSPSGAEFELRDGIDRVAARGRTGPDGRLAFDAVDPALHGPPYRIVETAPPSGLIVAAPVTIADASTDPASPTVVSIVDQPALVEVVIHKRLSVPGHGPPDRSGFGFGIVRREDELDRRVMTGADGRTPPIGLPFGEYDICEQQRPEWASELVDTGCRSVSIGTAELVGRTVVEVEYVNDVPTPTIDTLASTTSTTTTTPTSPPTTTPTITTTTTSPPTTTTTSTTTTTTTTTTTAPTTTAAPAPNITTTVASSPPTLPRTGADGATRAMLRLGDLVFVTGVGLSALAGLVPRRVRREHR